MINIIGNNFKAEFKQLISEMNKLDNVEEIAKQQILINDIEFRFACYKNIMLTNAKTKIHYLYKEIANCNGNDIGNKMALERLFEIEKLAIKLTLYEF